MDSLISRRKTIEYLMTNMGWTDEDGYAVDDADEKRAHIEDLINGVPSVPAVPLDKLCALLAEMYHCPASGWPASNHACHPGCPDEAFEKLCGTGCETHTDEERWHAFLTKWMEEQDAKEET